MAEGGGGWRDAWGGGGRLEGVEGEVDSLLERGGEIDWRCWEVDWRRGECDSGAAQHSSSPQHSSSRPGPLGAPPPAGWTTPAPPARLGGPAGCRRMTTAATAGEVGRRRRREDGEVVEEEGGGGGGRRRRQEQEEAAAAAISFSHVALAGACERAPRGCWRRGADRRAVVLGLRGMALTAGMLSKWWWRSEESRSPRSGSQGETQRSQIPHAQRATSEPLVHALAPPPHAFPHTHTQERTQT